MKVLLLLICLSLNAWADNTRRLIINSEPSYAEIYVNNVDTGKKTPEGISAPSESFELRLKLEGYFEDKETIPAAEKRKMIGVKLIKQPPTSGYDTSTQRSLAITSKPKDAYVFINGKSAGVQTPTSIFAPLEQFELKLKREGYTEYKETIPTADKRKSINIELKKTKPLSAK